MDWLKKLRSDQKLSGEAVADLANISQQHYSYIENGHRRPSVPVAKRIGGVLGFDWTLFFENTETA